MRVSLLSLSVIAGSLLITCAAIILSVWYARVRRDQQLRDHGKPVLIMPLSAPDNVPRAPIVHDAYPVRRSPITALAVAERVMQENLIVESRVLEGGEAASLHPEDVATMTTGETSVGANGARPEMILGHALRYHRPVDSTLQFLPGYLQVIDGIDAGQEIHFVRTPGDVGTTVTFGRSEGPPFRHIQLLEPTVSRIHARLHLDSDGWHLTNLSRTNPVVVDGRALDGNGRASMDDGDRIEMGALVFRFHAR